MASSPQIGQTLGHYRITERVGVGGMGVVYRAHDERLERDVALKVLPTGTLADEDARKRFRKEALALARLNHPNIAAVYDFDTQDGKQRRFLPTKAESLRRSRNLGLTIDSGGREIPRLRDATCAAPRFARGKRARRKRRVPPLGMTMQGWDARDATRGDFRLGTRGRRRVD